MKDELREEKKKELLKEITASHNITKDIREIYDELARVDEELAAEFSKRCNKKYS